MNKLSIVAALALALAGCAETVKPASVAGECRIFTAPAEPIQGVRPQDRRWISRTTEAGVAACGWTRPKAGA